MATVKVKRFLNNSPSGRVGIPGRDAARPVPPDGRDGRAPLPGPRGPYSSNLPNGSNGDNAQNQQNSSNGVNGLDSAPGIDGVIQYAKLWVYGTGYQQNSAVSWTNDTNYVIPTQNTIIDLGLTRTYSPTNTIPTLTSGIVIQKSGNYYTSMNGFSSVGTISYKLTVNGVPVNANLLALNEGDVVSAELSSTSWGASWYLELSVCEV